MSRTFMSGGDSAWQPGKTVGEQQLGIVSRVIIQILRWYQMGISPLFNKGRTVCIYDVPCSEYAVRQFESRNPLVALLRSVWRLLSCNPINARRRRRN